MTGRQPALAALVASAALLAPAAVFACAACGAGVNDPSRGAFLGSTILLSLLPLGLIGGGLWWIARHARGTLAFELEDRDAGAAAHPTTGAAGGSGSRAQEPARRR